MTDMTEPVIEPVVPQPTGGQGPLMVDPSLDTKTAAASLAFQEKLGPALDPVKNYSATRQLDNEIDDTSTATRRVANEGKAQASLIKPDGKSLSNIEKYTTNVSTQLDISREQDYIKDLGNKMRDLRSRGLDLDDNDRFLLEGHQNEVTMLSEKQQSLGLNWTESAITGDLVSVFRDMKVSVSDSPTNAVIAATGLLGFLGGPATGMLGIRLSTAAASAKYNWERTVVNSYLEIDEMKDADNNPIPHDVKDSIAQTSAYIQATLEFGTDMLLAKTSKLFMVDKLNEKLVKYTKKNPTFKKKLLDFSKRAATQGFAESLTEILQDNTGDFAKALGQTWTQEEGLKISAAASQHYTDFDINKNLETGVRSFIVGGASVGTADATAYVRDTTYNKAKGIYKKYTGKDISFGVDETVIDSTPTPEPTDSQGPTSFNGQQTTKTASSVKFNLPATQVDQPQTGATKAAPKPQIAKQGFTMVDGVPVHLSPEDAVILAEVIPNINNLQKFNIAENDISKEQLQVELMKKNRVNKVYIDKEKLESWAVNEGRKQAVAKMFLGGEKGAYLDAQKVPLTPEQYAELQSMGDVEILTDSTAITSDGATLGDLKAKLKAMGTKKIPNANAIPASGEMLQDGVIDAGQGKDAQVSSEVNSGTPDVDEAITGYEDFGLATKNTYESMNETEQKAYDKAVDDVRESMKVVFREKVLDEYEQTVSIQEREANLIAEEEIVNGIMNDDSIITVDTFMADPSLRIDPTTLPSHLQSYAKDPMFVSEEGKPIRSVFKKDGRHIDEVAGEMGVTPEQLMQSLASSPTSRQAYETKMKIQQARNRSEATLNTDLNEEAIKRTIDNKIKLKKEALGNILRKSPGAGLKLMYSVLRLGDKTSVDKVSINAREITDNTRIGDLSPKSYLNASRRHQNRANRASHRDANLVLAAQESEKSIVADELHKAATVTKAKVNRILDRVVSLVRDKTLASKLKSTGHLDAFKALTAMLGSKKITEKDLGYIKDFLLTHRENGLGSEVIIAPSLKTPVLTAQESGKAIDVNDLSLSQIETIKGYIDAVIADSNNVIKARVTEKELFGAIVAERVAAETMANPNYKGDKHKAHSKGGSKWFKEFISSILSVKRFIENNNEMLDAFEVEKNSVLRLLMDQIQGVGVFDNGMGEKAKTELSIKIKDLLTTRMGEETIKRLNSYAGKNIKIAEWVGKEGLTQSDGTIRLTNLIGMLLVYGSEDGRNRLSKFGIDVKTIPRILEKYLHKDDIKIVQAVHEAHGLLKEGIIVTEKTLYGNNNVEFVEGKPYMWHGEEIAGGYIHFSYAMDQKASTQAQWDMEEVNESLGNTQAVNGNRASKNFTKEGYKISRAENLDAFLDLDLNRVVHGSLGDIIASNTMLVPIHKTMAIMNDKSNRVHFINLLGKNGFNVFKANIMRTGRDLNFQVNASSKVLDNLIIRPLSALANNFMLSKILGSISSIMNQTVSVANFTLTNLKRPTLLFNAGKTYLYLIARPSSAKVYIHALAEHVPTISTDRTSYQIKDSNSFKLFDKSEAQVLGAVRRPIINATNTFTDVWLSKFMGGFDEFSKTSYATALIHSWMSGKDKRGPTLEQINKMSEGERKQKMFAFVNNELKKIFPDKSESSISYLQRHPIGKEFTRFFNDTRIALNYIVFGRISQVIQGFTRFPRNAAKNGVVSAIGKSTGDIIGNVLMLQLNLAVIDSMLRSFRGEDEEGDREGNKDFFTRWLRLFKKDILDPYMIVKGTADMLPIVSSYKFFLDTDGRAGKLTIPHFQWAEHVYRTAKNLADVGFNPKNWEDSQKRDAMNALSGLTPVPLSPINNYVYGESTAFKTGVKGAAMAGMVAFDLTKSLKEMVMSLKNRKVSLTNSADAGMEAPSTEAQEEVQSSVNAANLKTLMETNQGRAVVANAIMNDEIAPLSEGDLNILIFTESNGDPQARAATSSATGMGQFVVSTWNKQIEGLVGFDKAYHPNSNPEGLKDGRTDPEQSMKVLGMMHKKSAAFLVSRGITPTLETVYATHHFGDYPALSVIKSDDNRKLRDAYLAAFSNKAEGSKEWNKTTNGNSWVKPGMTVGQFKAGLERLLDLGSEKLYNWEVKNNKTFDTNEVIENYRLTNL